MSQEALRLEVRVAIRRRPAPGSAPTPAKAERQRQDRAARKARNLALAYWIECLIRSGQVEDLAAVARMCGVSRARVSRLMNILATPRVP